MFKDSPRCTFHVDLGHPPGEGNRLMPSSVVLTLRKPAKGEAAKVVVAQKWASPR